MKFYIGTTDFDWYSYLSRKNPEDVNFWQPGGKTGFKILEPGAPFLFKLKRSYNAIAGIGFFSSHTFLPISIAWDAFGDRNGCSTFGEFHRKIVAYRKGPQENNPTIGCIVLTNPIFFAEDDWISPPDDWAKSIVQGKSYDTNDSIGRDLWEKVEVLLNKYLIAGINDIEENQLILEPVVTEGYKHDVLSKVRLGQGAFRILITDAYTRRCAITGEKTLPVLEAAHIKPYSMSGPHLISNGVLMRSDIHKLFDGGYITITTDYKIEISNRIREEFENGREYYQYHGAELRHLPVREIDKPSREFLDWHNVNCFKS